MSILKIPNQVAYTGASYLDPKLPKPVKTPEELPTTNNFNGRLGTVLDDEGSVAIYIYKNGKWEVLKAKADLTPIENKLNTISGDVETVKDEIVDIQGDIEDINSAITNVIYYDGDDAE